MIRVGVSARLLIQFVTLVLQWKCLKTSTSPHYFKDSLTALQSCNIKSSDLPMKEKAANVGQGNWLITSASANYISETDTNPNTGATTTTRRTQCKVCIVSLPCGSELQGPNIHLRSDLRTCATQPPRVLDIVLPAPLNCLFSKLHPLHDLPRVVSAESAKLELLENVQLPEYKRRNLEEIDQIATPIIRRMATIHLRLSSRLDATV